MTLSRPKRQLLRVPSPDHKPLFHLDQMVSRHKKEATENHSIATRRTARHPFRQNVSEDPSDLDRQVYGLASIKSKFFRAASPGNGHFSPRASTNSLFQNLQVEGTKCEGKIRGYDKVLPWTALVKRYQSSTIQPFTASPLFEGGASCHASYWHKKHKMQYWETNCARKMAPPTHFIAQYRRCA